MIAIKRIRYYSDEQLRVLVNSEEFHQIQTLKPVLMQGLPCFDFLYEPGKFQRIHMAQE